MAVEDAACLTSVLCAMSQKSDLPAALGAYDTIRRRRTGKVLAQALDHLELSHMHDGPEQKKRDESSECETRDEKTYTGPYFWSSPQTLNWLYGYDELSVRAV